MCCTYNTHTHIHTTIHTNIGGAQREKVLPLVVRYRLFRMVGQWRRRRRFGRARNKRQELSGRNVKPYTLCSLLCVCIYGQLK